MEIGSSAKGTDIFGSPSTDSIFSAGLNAPATQEQEIARVTIKAQKREINRLRGYKLELTPADNQRLTKLQIKISEIERKAQNGTVRDDELEDRLELLAKADEIIGKPIVNVDEDEAVSEKLSELAGILEALLEPNLNPTLAKRVERLERVKDTLEESFYANPESSTLRAQFQNIIGLVNALKPERAISELSTAERKTYDDLAVLINEQAGAKIQLSSRDSIRVSELEGSIINLQQLLAADISGQPTPGDVARAYTRF